MVVWLGMKASGNTKRARRCAPMTAEMGAEMTKGRACARRMIGGRSSAALLPS